MIRFNKPYCTGKELDYIKDVINSGITSGNGKYTQKCQSFLENKYGFNKTFLTTSCTSALEMSAILLDIKPNDEVIVPSFTFVSTANAFIMHGAEIIFADSQQNHPNIDADKVEKLITANTKAIVVVHYAGFACDMDKLIQISKKYKVAIIEDASHAIDSFYKGKALGSFGRFATFSFHETKNISSGEGGLLVINEEKDKRRAEIIWEKGTNRSSFFRGEVNKYDWLDKGSSFFPADIVAAFLYAQLKKLDDIQNKRKQIWNYYYKNLEILENKDYIQRPLIELYATINAHLFYFVCRSIDERNSLIKHLKNNGVHAVFHYLSLHQSPYYKGKHKGEKLLNADKYTEQLIRLPLFYELTEKELEKIVTTVKEFYIRVVAK